MAASVLNSDRAEVSVYVVRAFVQLRAVLLDHKALADKLDALERRVLHHDNSLAEVIDAIRALMAQPKPANRPIGFTADVTHKPAKRYRFDSCLRIFYGGSRLIGPIKAG